MESYLIIKVGLWFELKKKKQQQEKEKETNICLYHLDHGIFETSMMNMHWTQELQFLILESKPNILQLYLGVH